MEWESAAKVQKNDAGEYRAFIDGEWVPVAKAQKNDAGEYWVQRFLSEPLVEPPSLSPEQIAAHAKKAAKSSARGENPLLADAADILSGLTTLPRNILKTVSPSAATTVFPETGVDKGTLNYKGAQFLDPYAWMTGGKIFQTANKLIKPSTLAGRSAAGATGGGLFGGLMGAADPESSATTGGMLGAGLGAALPVAGRAIGGAIDWLGGARPRVEAAKIFRSTLGDKAPAVQRALENADLSSGGLRRDVAQVIYKDAPDQTLALLESAKGYAPTAPDAARKIAEAQKSAQQAMLGRVAGGSTQEAALAAQQQMRSRLNQELNPDRVANLTAANIYNEAAARDLPLAALYKANSRNTHGLKTTSGGYPKDVPVDTGQMEMYAAAAKVLEDKLGTLQANGLKPLTIDPIVRRIDRILETPGQRGAVNREYLQEVRQELIDYAKKSGGTLNAFDLHTLRKEGLNNAIDRVLRGVEDPSGIKKNLATNVLPGLKNAIDDAIEAAGGAGWKSYLNKFSLGMSEIDRAKMGQMALEMTPKQLIKLVEGNAPKKVAKVFGPSAGTFNQEMGAQGGLIREVARQYARDAEIAARGGAPEAQEVLKSTLSENISNFKLPPILSRSATLANATLREIEGRLNRDALRILGEMRSDPKKALDLLRVLPADQRNLVLQYMQLNKGTAPLVSGGIAASGE